MMAGIAGGGAPISGSATTQPWSGHWWPYNDDVGPTLYDDGSPVHKLDQLIESYNPGYDSTGREWEQQHHSSDDTWSGHCQAWAAAAILGPPPAGSVTVNGITFTQDDLEALRTATLTDVGPAEMWGSRAWHESHAPGTESYDDVNPAWMHHLLVDRVAGKGESLIMDTKAGLEVWNHPVTRFESRPVTTHDDGSVTYETTVWFASPVANEPGTQEFPETYTYRLWETPDGRMDGEWTGASVQEHPDFAWTPKPSQAPGENRNPHVTPEWVNFLYAEAAAQNAGGTGSTGTTATE